MSPIIFKPINFLCRCHFDLSAGTRGDLSAGTRGDLSAGTRGDLRPLTEEDIIRRSA